MLTAVLVTLLLSPSLSLPLNPGEKEHEKFL